MHRHTRRSPLLKPEQRKKELLGERKGCGRIFSCTTAQPGNKITLRAQWSQQWRGLPDGNQQEKENNNHFHPKRAVNSLSALTLCFSLYWPFYSFCSPGNETQCLEYSRQVLYHWAVSPAHTDYFPKIDKKMIYFMSMSASSACMCTMRTPGFHWSQE